MKEKLSWIGLFWSPVFYARIMRDVSLHGSRMGFGILALAALLVTLPVIYAIAPQFAAFSASLEQTMLRLPDIEIQKGHARAHVQEPYIVETDPQNIGMRFVFDTKAAPLSLEEVKHYAHETLFLVVVTSENLFIHDPRKGEWRSYEFRRLADQDQVIGQPEYQYWMKKVQIWGLFVVAFMIWLYKWLGAMLLALFLGLVGRVAKSKKFIYVRYVNLVRVASFSLVPVMLLSALLPMPGALYLLLALVHYLFILWLARRGLRVLLRQPEERAHGTAHHQRNRWQSLGTD